MKFTCQDEFVYSLKSCNSMFVNLAKPQILSIRFWITFEVRRGSWFTGKRLGPLGRKCFEKPCFQGFLAWDVIISKELSPLR